MDHRSDSGKLPFRPGHLVITIVAVALAVVAMLFFNQVVEEPPAERAVRAAPRVVVAPVGARDLALEIAAIGRVVPWRQVDLAPEVSGRVEEVAVDLGDEVRRGDVVLRIDPGPYEEALAERRAGLLRAEARLEEADAALARSAALRERGAISEREYEAALATKRSSEADVRAAEASLARARRQLEDTELRAPFGGAIVERRVDPGALVGPERTVLGLALLDTVAVEVGLTEQELLRARDAPTAVIESSSLPGKVVEGTIDGVAERADPATGTYRVRVRVDNRAEPRFLGGMVVDVRITWRTLEGAMTVPTAALVDPDGSPHVYAVRDGVARRVPVEILARKDGFAALATPGAPLEPASLNGDGERGLRIGEEVVVVGNSLLEDGVTVEILERR